MCPCESSHTPCVLPYASPCGSSPQSEIISYWNSPEPTIGYLDSLLQVVITAGAIANNVLRVIILVVPHPSLLIPQSIPDPTLPALFSGRNNIHCRPNPCP